MLYSPTAHSNGASGFFLDEDQNAPSDAFSVQESDHEKAINTDGTYSFTAPTSGAQYGTLTITPKPAPTASEQLSEAKQAQKAQIERSANMAMVAPISFTNSAGTQATFPMDQNAQLKYLAAYTRYVVHGKALPSNGVSFMDVSGNPISMTITDIDNMSDPVFNQIETVEQKAAGLYSQINAVTTSTTNPAQTVQAITW